MLTTVTAFREPWEAHMFCARLNAEGIPAFVCHEYHIGNAWHCSLALGGVKVQVPDESVQDARAIEGLCQSGAFKLLLELDFGDMDDVRCPVCGSTQNWRRRANFRAVAAIAITFMTGVVFPPLGWVYFCERCGAKYEAPLYQRSAGTWLIILAVMMCELVLLSPLGIAAWMLLTPRYQVASILFIAMLGIGLVSKWLSSPDTGAE